jgi:hypothetical protein
VVCRRAHSRPIPIFVFPKANFPAKNADEPAKTSQSNRNSGHASVQRLWRLVQSSDVFYA